MAIQLIICAAIISLFFLFSLSPFLLFSILIDFNNIILSLAERLLANYPVLVFSDTLIFIL